MGKQRHDQGWKKRQATTKTGPISSTEGMAARLVSKGLASAQILDPRTARHLNSKESD